MIFFKPHKSNIFYIYQFSFFFVSSNISSSININKINTSLYLISLCNEWNIHKQKNVRNWCVIPFSGGPEGPMHLYKYSYVQTLNKFNKTSNQIELARSLALHQFNQFRLSKCHTMCQGYAPICYKHTFTLHHLQYIFHFNRLVGNFFLFTSRLLGSHSRIRF